MFELSYNEAIVIQRAQLAWYRRSIGLSGVRQIRKWTLPCPEHLHPDTKIFVVTINELVPRGGDFELLKRKWPKDDDPTRMAYSDAIRRGLL